MSKTADFYFDYASPWAFLVAELLPARLPGGSVTPHPFYLRGLEMFSKGFPYAPAKARYLMRDFDRMARWENIAVKFPTVFPINGLYALRGALWAQQNGGFAAYHQRVFRAAWQEDRDIAKVAVLGELASEAGLDKAAFLAGIAEPAIKEQLKQNTDAAIARGVFGVPFFLVGEEPFWGYDRLPQVQKACEEA